MNRSGSLLFLVWMVGACGTAADNPVLDGQRQTLGRFVADVDVLFVVDNSESMKVKQRQLADFFGRFVGMVQERGTPGRYRFALVTTGLESTGCPACGRSAKNSCVNETGESGRFQDRRGRITWFGEEAEYDFDTAVSCRVMADDLACLYDAPSESGIAVVDSNGCGYERGLSAIHRALSDPLSRSHNQGFLREEARLVVVVISDEDDCGDVGDVTEGIPGVDSRVCYYAAKEVGPDGSLSHPEDPEDRRYELAPVGDLHEFLLGLKGHRADMVQFAAVVGVADPDNPLDAGIAFTGATPSADIVPACRMPGCTARSGCEARPGTRYIQLADMFGLGENGMVDTICQDDFTRTVDRLARFVASPREFELDMVAVDPGSAQLVVNNWPVPAHACAAPGPITPCVGPGNGFCANQATCRATWTCHTPGRVRLADFLDPAALFPDTEIHIELVSARD